MNEPKSNSESLFSVSRVTNRSYPEHGSMKVMEGRLQGSSSTDYFHWDCPECGTEMFRELCDVRHDRQSNGHRAATVIFGIFCGQCDLCDTIKIGCLAEDGQYQCRRIIANE